MPVPASGEPSPVAFALSNAPPWGQVERAFAAMTSAETRARSAPEQFASAIEALERECARAPDRAETHFDLGNALYRNEQFAPALTAFERALAIEPRHIGAATNRGLALHALGRLAEAEDVLRGVAALVPDDLTAANGLAHVVRDLGRPEEAEALYRRVLERDGFNRDALCNLGIALRDQGRLSESENTLRTLVRLAPADANGHLNLALTLLLAGRFAEGWVEYEWRKQVRQMNPAGLSETDWDGQAFDGTLLVYAEQGTGDTVQFARYLGIARTRVKHLVLMCHEALAGPLSRVAGVESAISFRDAPPPHGRVAALLSLPHLLGEAAPGAGKPYLSPFPERIERWRTRLKRVPGFKVGLVWAGRREHPLDRRRSLSPVQMNLLPRIPGVTYVAIQPGADAAEIAMLRQPMLDLSGDIVDIEDSLAILSGLDLLVSVDTAMAHCAGAMGKPTLLLLPTTPDWRWQRERQDSPWYPGHLLFRQQQAGDWVEPMLRIGAEIARRAAPAPPSVALNQLFEQAVDHHRHKRHAQAELAIWHGLSLQPAAPRLAITLGALRVVAGDYASAIGLLGHGMLKGGPDAEALANLGVALRGENRTDEAERAYRRALEIAPGLASAQYNFGNLLSARGKWREAELLYRRALAGESHNVDALYNLANAVRDQGRLDEAIALYRQALELRPDYHAVRNSLGMALLLDGQFAEGWQEYEARWLSDMVPRGFTQPVWDGSKNARKTLLIHAEQGLGDTIQFLRFVPRAAQRFGGKIMLEVQAPLVELARRLMPKAKIVAQNDALPPFDFRISTISLARWLEVRAESIPAEIPYLAALDERVKQWRKRLGKAGVCKIGLVWAGNPKHKNDANRTVPYAALDGLPVGPGVRYFALQVGDRHGDGEGGRLGAIDLGVSIETFDDTAAILTNLDLVIACDTAAAHLAGALAVPVWMLLPFAPDWRWILARDDSPWYPTMRLFRQFSHGDWSGPIAAMAEALGPIAAAEGPAGRALAKTLLSPLPGRKEFAKAARPAQAPTGANDALALAEAELRLGRPALAERACDLALRMDRRSAAAQSLLASIRRARGASDETRAELARAVELDPESIEQRERLARRLFDEGRKEEAKEHFRAVLARTQSVDALELYVGLCANALEGLPAFERLTVLQPGEGKWWHKLGSTLYLADRIDEAESAIRQALAVAPGMAEAQSDLGAVLTRKGDVETGIAALNRAIEMSPGNAAAYGNLGVALRKAGRADEAVAAFDKAIALNPAFPDFHWNRSLAALHGGRYEEGWRDFEWRWQVANFPSPVRGFKEPLWRGEPLDGRTILIYAEQGLGDAFQFLRYVPLVAARGGRVVLEVSASLVELCRCLGGVAEIVALGQSLPRFDVQAPLLSLPLAFNTTLATIPCDIPYLSADPARVAAWRARRDRRPTIGLIWAGRKKPDPTRTIGLAALRPLLDLPGMRFVGLQKDLEPGDEALLSELGEKLENWGGGFESFADTAAAHCAVDLVVSIDTSSAHLAGALGRPTWVLLPRAVDWRWMTGRADSPWYPTMRLFRQTPEGGWSPVVASVVEAIRAWIAQDAPGSAADRHKVDEAFHRGISALAAGRLDEAEMALRSTLTRDSTHAEAVHHLGIVALKRGKAAEARALIERAVALDDTLDVAWANLGVAQRESGDLAAAAASYGRALKLNPDQSGAHYNLGNIYAARGDDDQAIACFRRAVALAPRHANTINNLGLALQRRGQLDEAIELLKRAAEIDPRGTDALANLALALNARKMASDALAVSRKAVAERPGSALAHRVHSMILKGEGELDAAVSELRHALALEPQSAEAYNLLGNALKGLGRPRDAIAAFDRALAIEPNRADARVNRATVLLALGDFIEGWSEYEWRWRALGIARRAFAQPEWDGKPLGGKTILVHAEQGIGDTIQFARYLPLVAKAGGRVVAEVQSELVELVRGIDGVAEVVAAGHALPDFAVQAPMLSLPRLMGTTIGTIPSDMPYLHPTQGAGTGLPDLAHAPGLKVGLAWAGNASHANDRWRSMALGALAPILAVPGVTFVSLQKGEAAKQLDRADVGILDAGPALGTFADTAALIDDLDLVIAVDTAVAHCAGALGRPVWVLLPVAPDWRWLLNTPRSPWYPTMRLYRQDKLGDWAAAVAQVAEDLAREVATRPQRKAAGASNIEVSPEPETAKNRKPVVFKWGMSSYFGWGVYGVNLVMSWADDKDVLPVCSVPYNVDHIVVDALRRRRMEPALKASRRLIEGLAARRGEAVNSSSLVLHGLGNRFGAVASAHQVDLGGATNIGVLFMENSTIDAEARGRSKRFELLVAGSSWNKRMLEAGGVSTPITVVLQGVDRTLFHPAPKTGLFKDRFVVFSGGKLEYRKGQDLVLLAFRAFAERHPEALLVTAWHSPWPDLARALTGASRVAPVPFSGGKADLVGWAAANGIGEDKFIDLGQVPNAQMPTILRECDAALFLNRGEGGTNLVAMECMAVGLPCILSANTGHLDLIGDDTCVPLVRQGPTARDPSFGTEGWGESDVEEAVEALEALWRDRERARAIGRGGAALLDGMSWPQQMQRLKQVILPYVR